MHIGQITIPDFPLLLAPMEAVSDPPFRAVCKAQGADLLYTEFISSEGLIRDAMKCRRKLDIFDAERPVGIQIFGGDEDSLGQASAIVEVAGPDLLDINFGCPVKKVAGRGAGAGVLKDLTLMTRLTTACVKSTKLPVTVKTRLGWDDSSLNVVEAAERLQDAGISALAIHGRTRCQMYKGVADWSLIAEVRNNPRMHIPVFGNGDINSAEKALEYKNRYGVDGIMIGRAAIGYPWIFREIRAYIDKGIRLAPPTLEERLGVCRMHLEKSVAWKGPVRGIYEMRSQYGKYLKGLPDLKRFVKQLVTLSEPVEIVNLLAEIGQFYAGIEFTSAEIELIDYHEHCPL